MKKNSPLAAYKTARTNLWILLALSAVNVLFALLGSDTYFLFSCFISYLVAIYARVFYDYTWDPVYLVIGMPAIQKEAWLAHRRPGAVLRGHRRHAPLLCHRAVRDGYSDGYS